MLTDTPYVGAIVARTSNGVTIPSSIFTSGIQLHNPSHGYLSFSFTNGQVQKVTYIKLTVSSSVTNVTVQYLDDVGAQVTGVSYTHVAYSDVLLIYKLSFQSFKII